MVGVIYSYFLLETLGFVSCWNSKWRFLLLFFIRVFFAVKFY